MEEKLFIMKIIFKIDNKVYTIRVAVARCWHCTIVFIETQSTAVTWIRYYNNIFQKNYVL